MRQSNPGRERFLSGVFIIFGLYLIAVIEPAPRVVAFASSVLMCRILFIINVFLNFSYRVVKSVFISNLLSNCRNIIFYFHCLNFLNS